MARYEVRFYRGDYARRQRGANADNAICYVEHHFNSSDSDANYALAVVASNASEKSIAWGRWYAREIAETFGIRNMGVSVGGYNGRGNANLKYTDMPAILLEPFFISTPAGAQWARSRLGDLARILAESIREYFPNGGVVAFSVGHRYKTSTPNDLGAPAKGGGWEAELAEPVLWRAKTLLEAEIAPLSSDSEETPILATAVSDWAEEAQRWVVEQQISDGTRPHDPVTREELWVMLHRAQKDDG